MQTKSTRLKRIVLSLMLLWLAACVEEPAPLATATPSPIRIAVETPAAALAATATPSPTAATATAAATDTPRPTPTQTPTASATATPSPLPTRTPPPPLPPATPDANSEYRLAPWTPEAADEAIARLHAYPDTLAPDARGYNDVAYYDAYRYATLALEEALFRFPDAPAAARWRWQLAYDYVRLGDARAPAAYAALLAGALARKETTPAALPSWLAVQEPRLTLSTTEVVPGSRAQAAFLLELGAGDSGTYLWLVAVPEGYRLYPLAGDNDFDLAHGAGFSAGLADITGDGSKDVFSVHGHQPGSGPSFYYTDLVLYDLGQEPPRRLAFQPPPTTHLGWGENDGWSVVRRTGGAPVLRLHGLPFDRCKAVAAVNDYVWNGHLLQGVSTGYDVAATATGGSRFCLPFVFAAAEQGNEAARQYLAAALQGDVEPEARDEWRYRLGIYQALAGAFAEATNTFADLISDPAGRDGEWVRQAARFLDAYQQPDDLYRACSQAELCNDQVALPRLVAPLPAAAYGIAATYLQERGVPLLRSRFFDVDGDGGDDQWLLVRNGSLRMDVWLLVRDVAGVHPVFVATVPRDDLGFSLERLTAVQNQPLLRLRSGGEESLFVLSKDPAGTRPPAVVQLRPVSGAETGNFTRRFLAESQAALLAGEAPALVRDSLLTFRRSTAFDCMVSTSVNICPDYDYAVALAYELAGDVAAATDAYREFWQTYPDNVYTIIVRSKLEVAATALP